MTKSNEYVDSPIFSCNYPLKIVRNSKNDKIARNPERPDTMYALLIMFFCSAFSQLFGRGGKFRAASGKGYVQLFQKWSPCLSICYSEEKASRSSAPRPAMPTSTQTIAYIIYFIGCWLEHWFSLIFRKNKGPLSHSKVVPTSSDPT